MDTTTQGEVRTNLVRTGYIHTLRPFINPAIFKNLRGFKMRKSPRSYQLTQVKSYPEARELVAARHAILAGINYVGSIDLGMSAVLPSYTDNPAEFTNIARVGVELEGGWHNPPTEIHGDGSVAVEDCDGCSSGYYCEECDTRHYNHDSMPYTGEAHTYPVPYNATEPKAKILDRSHPLWKQFYEFYPNRVNRTCGLHVHVSLKTVGAYSAFVNRQFQPWLLAGLGLWMNTHFKDFSDSTAWYNAWDFMSDRLSGRESYCSGKYVPRLAQTQIRTRRKYEVERYTAVNYCYGVHGTFEVRVLPMFNEPTTAAAAVHELLRLVQLWDTHFSPRVRRPIVLADSTSIASSLLSGGVSYEPKIRYRACSCAVCEAAWRWNMQHRFTSMENVNSEVCPFAKLGFLRTSNASDFIRAMREESRTGYVSDGDDDWDNNDE